MAKKPRGTERSIKNFVKVLNMKEEIKKAIRESLIYALTYSNTTGTTKRLIVHEFYNALNRRKVITNQETEEEIKKTIEKLEFEEIKFLFI